VAVTGGFCGGDIDAFGAGAVTVGAGSDLDADGGAPPARCSSTGRTSP
jgi:hypothetical protein